MKRPFIILILLMVFSYGNAQSTTELTKEQCRASIDSIWANCGYNKALKEVAKVCSENPNNDVSLTNMYLVRKHMKKCKIRWALDKLTPENKLKAYALSLDKHVKTDQLKKGNQYYDFSWTTSDAEKHNLSDIAEEKDVLLIFYGLSCMGRDGIKYIADIYERLDHNKVEVVSLCFADDQEQLKGYKSKYKIPWELGSDFQGNHSDAKIKYGVQGTPTMVFINSEGKLLVIDEGFSKKALKNFERYCLR
ncbi:redoxin domain-containing protein [Puteibacter caeruleilacunae]|nr:redoxin domain-containing protein [Puteibacter caeruleilacunae]